MDLGPKVLMSTDNSSLLQSSTSQLSRTEDVTTCRRSDEEIELLYEINGCSEWILQGGFRSVAMQFPDDMLCESVRVSDLIERRIGFKPFILADTSYGSCCVDEIAAQHVNAECILHFGDSCMSGCEGRIPVKYVIPVLPFDEDDFRAQLSTILPSNVDLHLDSEQRITLIVDICASHVAKLIADIVDASVSKSCRLINLAECGGEATSSESIDADSVIFVGETQKSPRLTLLMMANPNKHFISYDLTKKILRKEDADVNRTLRRRLYYIEKAKDAQIVGIVVGALSVDGYLQVVDRLRSLCRAADKRFIVLSVGKINVAKLSNFADAVDVFVWVSCPFNIMLDTSDYPHPILTPFELEVACNRKRQWFATAGWITNFRPLLEGEFEGNQPSERDEGSDMETDISLITGRLRRPAGNQDCAETTSDSVIPRSDALQMQPVSVESRFLEKSWKGLEEKLGETPVVQVQEGRRGIASGYKDEGERSAEHDSM